MSSITRRYSICRKMTRLAIGLLAMLVPFLFSSCASQEVKQPYGPAFNYAALTSTLERGVSSAADVQAVLGEPNGSGGYYFPVVAEPYPIWFYEKFRRTWPMEPVERPDAFKTFNIFKPVSVLLKNLNGSYGVGDHCELKGIIGWFSKRRMDNSNWFYMHSGIHPFLYAI